MALQQIMRDLGLSGGRKRFVKGPSYLEQSGEEMSRRGWLDDADRQRFARALGWFSIVLGVSEITIPRLIARFIGIRNRHTLLRLLGTRELANGIGILAEPGSAGWVWARVAGDAMDLSLLGAALAPADGSKVKIATATAAVGGVTIADVICGLELTRDSGTAYESVWKESGIRIEKSVVVNRSPEELYKFWSDFQSLPRFMRYIESVQTMENKRSRWVIKTPAGKTLRWDTVLTSEEPNKSIAWRSLEGADIDNSGWVRFERAPDGHGTVVRTEVKLTPHGGAIGAIAMPILSTILEHQVKENLRRFKQLMETGEIPTIEGQPSGRLGRSEWI